MSWARIITSYYMISAFGGKGPLVLLSVRVSGQGKKDVETVRLAVRMSRQYNRRVNSMSKGLIGIIGGTGLGEALAGRIEEAALHQVDTPFGRPSGPILVGKMAGRTVAVLNRHGIGHRLAPSEVPFGANIFALKKLGVRAVIASGAVGSLRKEIKPRDLVIVDQVIDKTFRRNGSFFGGYGAVHCEMSEPVCSRLGSILAQKADDIGIVTHNKGTYVCMEGPQFSTRAESLMHRKWGGDLIGMTAMPEAKFAREAQMCYCLVCLVSDYDCWSGGEDDMPALDSRQETDKQTLLQEIIGNLEAASNNAIELITAVLESDSELCCEVCSCRKSLELAVWTEPEQIEPSQRQKLKVLFD